MAENKSAEVSTAGNRLRGKVAIVTGSSNGIGRAIALALAAQSTRLVICADLDPDCKGAEDDATPTHARICSLHGNEAASFIACDISIGESDALGRVGLEAVVALAVRLAGRLDILVNNAGTFVEGPLHEMSDSDWQRSMDVNAGGVFRGCKYAIRQFLSQDEDTFGERGCIINVSSIAAMKGLMQCGAYCASKAAIASLTREIAVEYGSRRIRANAVCPGYTDTIMLRPWLEDPTMRQYFLDKIPAGRLAKPEEMSGAVVWLACAAESSYVNGTSVVVDGGFLVK